MIFPAPQNWIWRVYFATSWSTIWGYLWTFNFWSLLRPRRPVKLLNIGYNIPLPKIRIKLIPCARACWPSQPVWFIQTGCLVSPRGWFVFPFPFDVRFFFRNHRTIQFTTSNLSTTLTTREKTCQPHEKNTDIWTQPARISTPLPPPLTR